MKKFVSLLLCVLFLISASAIAESIDYAALSDEELHAIIDAARNELTSRELVFAEKTVLVDQDGVKLYLTGEYRMSNEFIYLQAVLVNDNDFPVWVRATEFSANGWDVYCSGFSSTEAGKKKKDEIYFKSVDAEISEFSELEDFEAVFTIIRYDDDRKEISSTDPGTIHFNID